MAVEKEEEEAMLLKELYNKFKEAHVNLSLAEEEEEEEEQATTATPHPEEQDLVALGKEEVETVLEVKGKSKNIQRDEKCAGERADVLPSLEVNTLATH